MLRFRADHMIEQQHWCRDTWSTCVSNKLYVTNYFDLFRYFLHAVVFALDVKALNGLLCADVPLRNYLGTSDSRQTFGMSD